MPLVDYGTIADGLVELIEEEFAKARDKDVTGAGIGVQIIVSRISKCLEKASGKVFIDPDKEKSKVQKKRKPMGEAEAALFSRRKIPWPGSIHFGESVIDLDHEYLSSIVDRKDPFKEELIRYMESPFYRRALTASGQ